MQLTNGKTYKQFYSDQDFWIPEAWHEGELLLVDGQDWGDRDIESIPDDAIVSISGGIVSCEDPGWGKEGLSMDELFRVWRNDDTHKSVLVNIPRDRLEAFEAYVKSIGGQVGV